MGGQLDEHLLFWCISRIARMSLSIIVYVNCTVPCLVFEMKINYVGQSS